MFDDLDFNILNDPEYKEDAVREDIIMLILKKLGYSSTGTNKIRRGIPLTHPFVNIGSTQRKINIVPDYILETENAKKWILDAKAPNENIIKSGNVEQAYSYAINPEVRCEIYGLCNGRQLTVFHISEVAPLLVIDIEDIENNWSSVEHVLGPLHMEKPNLKDFKPDFGLHLLKAGADKSTTLHFVPAWANSIAKVSDNLYSFFSVLNFGEETYAGSFDFDKSKYDEFIASVPEDKREFIDNSLKNAPFRVHFESQESSFGLVIEAKMGDDVCTNDNESYIPLEVIKFENIT